MNILLVNPDTELSDILNSSNIESNEFEYAETHNAREILKSHTFDLVIVSEINELFDRNLIMDIQHACPVLYLSKCGINVEHMNIDYCEHIENREDYAKRLIEVIESSPKRGSIKSEDFYRSIYSVTLKLAKETDFTKKIQIIVDTATELLRAADAAVYVSEQQTGNLVPIYSNAKKERDEIMSFVIPFGEGVTGRVAKEGKSGCFNYDDEVDIAIHVDGTGEDEDSRESVLACPMFEGDKVMGVITVGIIDAKFDKSDIEKLEIFSRMAELEIKRTWALRELNESEEKYRNLVKEIHDGIFIFTRTRILFVNPHSEVITGYSERELLNIGMDDLLILSENDERCFDNMNEKEMETHGREFQLMTKSGIIRPVELKCKGIKYRNTPAML